MVVAPKNERRIDWESLVKLGKSAAESFRLLTNVYVSRSRVFVWVSWGSRMMSMTVEDRVDRIFRGRNNDWIITLWKDSVVNQHHYNARRTSEKKAAWTVIKRLLDLASGLIIRCPSSGFRPKNRTPVSQPPNPVFVGPDSTWLLAVFKTIKRIKSETRVESVEAVKTKSTRVLRRRKKMISNIVSTDGRNDVLNAKGGVYGTIKMLNC